jgi:hypothetical protein
VPSAEAASEGSLERAAKKACLSGDAAKGVAILADLYVRTEDPVFIFNQGRCFEQNGRYEEAIVRFREFLQKNQDKGNSSDQSAEKHIASCQAILDSQRQRDKPSVAPAATPAQPSAPAAAAAATPPAAPLPPPEPSPAPSPAHAPAASTLVTSPDTAQQTRPAGAGLRVAGVAAAAVGLAGIATGIALNVKANSIANELETNRPFLRSREETRASLETWGWVGYGVGAACVAGGAVLYYLGYSRERSGNLALLPSAQAGSFSATLQGVF